MSSLCNDGVCHQNVVFRWNAEKRMFCVSDYGYRVYCTQKSPYVPGYTRI